MKPEFAHAVDPIFLHVLELLDRIGRNESISVQSERDRILNLFRDAEAHVGSRTGQGWELAKFALTAWIDDVLILAPWDHRDWWKDNTLEFLFFNQRERATDFFVKAKEAAALTRRDSLEVFYVCVVLGFRGIYGISDSSEAVFMLSHLKLPVDIQTWSAQTARSIQLGQGRPSIHQAPRPRTSAPPLKGKFSFISTAVFTVALAALTIIVGFYSFKWDEFLDNVGSP